MIWVILEWSSGFPNFLQFKPEFCNKVLMIWVTVSSRSCFCLLYRASPSSVAKNIMKLILVLTIWWCPCVESSPVLCTYYIIFIHSSVFEHLGFFHVNNVFMNIGIHIYFWISVYIYSIGIGIPGWYVLPWWLRS